jgi:hypothetical protein
MKQSIEEYLANGGAIQRIHYKTFEQVSQVPSPAGMRGVINDGRTTAYHARLAGIASGAARRLKSELLEKKESLEGN